MCIHCPDNCFQQFYAMIVSQTDRTYAWAKLRKRKCSANNSQHWQRHSLTQTFTSQGSDSPETFGLCQVRASANADVGLKHCLKHACYTLRSRSSSLGSPFKVSAEVIYCKGSYLKYLNIYVQHENYDSWQQAPHKNLCVNISLPRQRSPRSPRFPQEGNHPLPVSTCDHFPLKAGPVARCQ